MLYDLSIVGWLLWPLSRPWAYAVVVFHLLTGSLFQIGVFPGVMMGATLIFVSDRWLTLEGTAHNLLNEAYFTRRAEAYPGPGIIPSDGRSFYLTAQAKF